MGCWEHFYLKHLYILPKLIPIFNFSQEPKLQIFRIILSILNCTYIFQLNIQLKIYKAYENQTFAKKNPKHPWQNKKSKIPMTESKISLFFFSIFQSFLSQPGNLLFKSCNERNKETQGKRIHISRLFTRSI